MLRAATTIRALLLLGGFGAAIAAAQPAAAQSQCISGYYYNPFYGCMVAGEALRPLPRIITPPNDFAHPHYPSSGFDPIQVGESDVQKNYIRSQVLGFLDCF